MNIFTNPDKLRGMEKRVKVEKISRRTILKSLGITGGLVLAAPVTSRQAFGRRKAINCDGEDGPAPSASTIYCRPSSM